MKKHEAELVLKEALRDDVHKDTVRVHWKDRGPFKDKNGQIVRVKVKGKSRPLVMRGLADDRRGQILLDFVIRDEFGLRDGQIYKFEFSSVGVLGQLKWACKHSDPGIRVATWLGIWLGGIGIVLSLAQLYQGWNR